MLQDYVTVNSPMLDGIDNDADGLPDNAGEEMMYGRLNINTASEIPLKAVLGISAGDVTAQSLQVINNLIAYRDTASYTYSAGGTLDFRLANRPTQLGVAGLRTGRGFASVGEAALVMKKLIGATNSYGALGQSYKLSDASTTDDGLANVNDDLSKPFSSWAWASDQLTVRSDTYLAYVGVLGATGPSSGTASAAGGTSLTDGSKHWNPDQWKNCMVVITSGTGAGQANTVLSNNGNTLNLKGNWGAGAGATYQVMHLVKRYMAVIDRSNCRAAGDTPRVLMFAEIK
jgi:hypothetical protein